MLTITPPMWFDISINIKVLIKGYFYEIFSSCLLSNGFLVSKNQNQKNVHRVQCQHIFPVVEAI